MDLHTDYSAYKRRIDISAYIEHSDFMKAVGTEVYRLVAQRLADDLYEKQKENFSKFINPRNLVKRVVKRLELRVEEKVKSFLRGTDD